MMQDIINQIIQDYQNKNIVVPSQEIYKDKSDSQTNIDLSHNNYYNKKNNNFKELFDSECKRLMST